jgi:hypothetical protein
MPNKALQPTVLPSLRYGKPAASAHKHHRGNSTTSLAMSGLKLQSTGDSLRAQQLSVNDETCDEQNDGKHH